MPKVLFVGLAESTHTASWIRLIEDTEFDFALFSLPTGALPVSKSIPTYMADHRARRGAKDFNTLNLPFLFANIIKFLRLYLYFLNVFEKIQRVIHQQTNSKLQRERSSNGSEQILELQLTFFLRHFKPDIVHTLGVFPASSLFLKIADDFPQVRWVVQVRGGPDIELNSFEASKNRRIREILSRADVIICDSSTNYELAFNLGADQSKFKIGVVCGSGGLDFKPFAPSFRAKSDSRTVVWPKAYEAISSKASPVLEAIKLAWNDIKPVHFTFLWLEDSELELWIKKSLDAEILASITFLKRVSHLEALQQIAKAKVLLAPSLMDGIPNVMLEAMMFGTIPIVSPLPTILSLVSDPKNVVLARNLYPGEIAQALIRALNDDEGNESRVITNYELAKKNYDRTYIRPLVLEMYRGEL